MNLIFILFLGAIDRLRGSGLAPKSMCQVVYGLTTGMFLLFPSVYNIESIYFLFSFTLLFVAGVSIGWGQPVGAYIGDTLPDPAQKEAWQFGILVEEPFLAVLFRGFIWAACVSPCIYFKQDLTMIFMIAIFIAFPLAATLARLMVKRRHLIGWELHEVFRGLLLGLFIYLLKRLV